MADDKLDAKTKDDLLEIAKRRNIKGRTDMDKEELIEAIRDSSSSAEPPATFEPRIG
jgi:hypothetical protein